jgi:hypothetical protein
MKKVRHILFDIIIVCEVVNYLVLTCVKLFTRDRIYLDFILHTSISFVLTYLDLIQYDII